MNSQPSPWGVSLCLWFAILVPAMPAGTPPLTLDAGFQPTFATTRGAALYAVTLQPDGRVLVAGDFALVNGTPRRSLARLRTDGSLDPDFDARGGVAGLVYDLAVQKDGGILLAGQFTAVDGVARTGVARLLPDGRLDAGFAPRFEGREGWLASTVQVQPDGRILVAGQFQTVEGWRRDGIVRLLPDGRLDGGFDPGFGLNGGAAYDLALQADGRVLVAGAFATVGSVFSPGVARLQADGRVDTSFIGSVFSGPAWGRVFTLSIQPGLGIVIAGEFDTVDAQSRNRIARLQFDGSLDESFDPQQGIAGGEEAVFDLVALGSGRVVVTGRFAGVGDAEHSSLAGFATTGAADAEFDPGAGLESAGPGIGSMLALQPDGRIIAVGQFQTAASTRRHCLARFHPDGSLDETFSTTDAFLEFAGTVKALAALPDGGWLVGGDFERVNGTWREGLARLDAAGRLDSTFDAGLDPGAVVNTVARDAEGRIVIGGEFAGVQGLEQANLARLLPDGTRDESFLTAGPDGPVNAVLVEPSGGILAAGEFIRLDNFRRLHLARLDGDGVVDAEFDARFEMGLDHPFLSTLALQADGGILAGGRFNQVNGETRRHLARLKPDGTLDAAFAPHLILAGPDAAVRTLALFPDGRVLAGGSFNSVNGVPQSGLARLRPDGSPDPTFHVDAGVAGGTLPSVLGLCVRADGRVGFGGEFTSYRGQPAVNSAFVDSRGGLLAGAGLLAPDGPVNVLAKTASGQILVGGSYCRLGSTERMGLARFDVAPADLEFYLDISIDSEGQPLIEWEGGYTLEEAESPTGPWTEVAGAVSPYPPKPGAGHRYYRLRQPAGG